MSKLKIFHILSIVILVALIGFAVFNPIATGAKYSEVQREQLFQTEDEWIIQYRIVNHEGKDTEYTIAVSVAGKQYNEQFLLEDGGKYTYTHHIRRDTEVIGEASFTISKKGEESPFEQATYYLR